MSVIFFRLGYIQIIWGKQLQAKASEQWQRDLPVKAYRGDIVDTNGVVLATTKTCYTLYVRPKSVVDSEKTAQILSGILQLDYTKVLQKVTKRGVSEVTIARQLDNSVVEKIRNENLPGVYLSAEGIRSYTYGNYLSQVLGFVSVDGVGQTGIEAYYDKYLQGINGQVLTDTDLVGKELEEGQMSYIPAIDGLTVTLTIDSTIQMIVENVLKLAMYQQNPISCRCIVTDVTTGEILAMASNP
ncbi:MAG: stage V sporulation protein D, partial [Clostridia bacterium]|nr:stage V sporulation protein D [Clostridia bacterium]